MWALLLNYLSYASVLLPNSSTLCKTTDICQIVWDNEIVDHAHLEVQIKYGDDNWSSTTVSGKSFLSVIVNEDTNHYDWIVPQYIGQFWEHPKRVVIEDLSTNERYYSSVFTVPGITLTMNTDSDSLNSNTDITLSWASNELDNLGLYLLNSDSNIIYTINNNTLSVNSSYLWTVPYYPNEMLNLMLRSDDDKTYTLSNSFQILETTTTPTTSPTTSPTMSPTTSASTSVTTTETITYTTNITTTPEIEVSVTGTEWYFIFIYTILAVLAVLGLICWVTINYCTEDTKRVHPYDKRKHGIENPVYDVGLGNQRRVLPPISPPTNLRSLPNPTQLARQHAEGGLGSPKVYSNKVIAHRDSDNIYSNLKREKRFMENSTYSAI